MSFEYDAFGASDESDSQASGSFSAVKIAGSNWIMLSLVVTITFINQICNVTITLPFTKFVDHSTQFGWLSKQFNFFTFTCNLNQNYIISYLLEVQQIHLHIFLI